MSSSIEKSFSLRVALGCAAGLAAALLVVGVQHFAWALLWTGGLLAVAVFVVGISAWYSDVPPCGAVSEDEDEAAPANCVDKMSEARSDFVGHCHVCGRAVFLHDAVADEGGMLFVHAKCLAEAIGENR